MVAESISLCISGKRSAVFYQRNTQRSISDNKIKYYNLLSMNFKILWGHGMVV
jgi:hypothetical protein